MADKKCSLCDKTEGLLACAQCKCTYYCGAQHQKEGMSCRFLIFAFSPLDWPTHKTVCVKKQGLHFLEENKTKEGVITLPSGNPFSRSAYFMFSPVAASSVPDAHS
jgi:hypothetical protein